jgi:hypothetical protein
MRMAAMTNARFKVLRSALAAFAEIQKQIAMMVIGDGGIIEAIHQLVRQTDVGLRRAPDGNESDLDSPIQRGSDPAQHCQ